VQEDKLAITFAEIGMEFPLFAAPTEDAIVDEPGQCAHCGNASQIVFNGSCYTCFRAGEGSHTIDTEYGMVRPEDAVSGCTHGIPLDPNNLPGLPLVAHAVDPKFPDEHWYSVRFDPADLIELTRTPIYHTWQGERWLFCCEKPSIFMGRLDSSKLAELAAERNTSKEATIAGLLSISEDKAGWIPRAIEGGGGLYLFRCQSCSKLRAHFDMD
jgi:uncharacterized protein CbrC (UPF0167 family)